jgi:hypothetical protein
VPLIKDSDKQTMKTKEEIFFKQLKKSNTDKYHLERTNKEWIRSLDFFEAALLSMEEYASQSKFISVNDEPKPKLGQKALVIQNPLTTATKEPLFAIYNGEKFAPYVADIISGFEMGRTWADITHWMPLPNLPTEYLKQISQR